jgi:hypothetical protein
MTDLETRYAGLSINSLEKLHQGACDAYANDRSLSEQEKILGQEFGSALTYYGTDKYADWPLHVDAIEAALTTKGESFTPISM